MASEISSVPTCHMWHLLARGWVPFMNRHLLTPASLLCINPAPVENNDCLLPQTHF